LAAAVFLCWCIFSLSWTPFFAVAFEKITSVLVLLALFILGVMALPLRMKTSNLYLITTGAAAALVFAFLLALFGGSDKISAVEGEGRSLERGLIILSLFIWPAIGWLTARTRLMEAIVLAACTVAAALLLRSFALMVAVFLGGVVYAAVFYAYPVLRKFLGLACIIPLLIAPVLPFILYPLGKMIAGANAPNVVSLSIWRDIISGDPIRLITGHGLEAAVRSRFTGVLPFQTPSGFLFETWYDFGIVGVIAVACLLWLSIERILNHASAFQAAKLAAFFTVFILALFGVGGTQIWWLISVAVMVLAFTAVERGQPRLLH
jgi:hypothetical protein